MFKAAKEHGAQVVDPNDESSQKKEPASFKGSAGGLGILRLTVRFITDPL